MTITRVNPGSWAVNDKLTSAQANGLDLNGTYALDKRAGQTDTLASVVTTTGAGQLVGGTASGIISNVVTGIAVTSTGTLDVLSGGTVNVNSGGSVVLKGSGGVQVSATGTISVTAGGTINAPGASYVITDGNPPVFSPATSRTLIVPMAIDSIPGGWSASATFTSVQLDASATTGAFTLPTMHNGATLTSISIGWTGVTHAGGAPATPPTFNIYRLNTTTGLSDTLFAASPTIPSSATTSTSYSINAFSPNQNNVIDNTLYLYSMLMTSETGANSVAGSKMNLFLKCTFSTINSLKFP